MPEDLPVILVSAVDVATADRIISELIERNGSEVEDNHVWELSNKYYRARVRLRPLPDDAAGADRVDADAHIVYLAENECTGAALEARCARAGAGRGGVRLALCACAGAALPPALLHAARARGYEPVPLRAPAAPAPPGPFPELRGLARAREALHAHVWPGLELAAAPPAPAPAPAPAPGDDAEDGRPAGEAEVVRRAEAFAEALGALQAAAAARPLRARGSRAERLQRADQLLDAFCRALGTDPDLL